MARILIVDDEPLIREMAACDLEDAGHQVEMAVSGDEAAAILQADRNFHYLFTDIRMPGATDGWTLAELARSLVPGIRIVFASGLHDAKSADETGTFLTKPYTPRALIAAFAG